MEVSSIPMKDFIFKITAFIIFLHLLCVDGYSQLWTSRANGNWNNAATWTRTGAAGPAIPPSTLTSGMSVRVLHNVIWPSAFSSTLEIQSGAELAIIRGIFEVGNGVSMTNRGR